ncbi:MAG: PTS system mannose/fructose/sorbose family transporter subunit IID [Thermodesulfobacteriota bacterium]
MSIPLKTLLLCFFRTYFIGACINLRGLQNIGLSFAMEPGLQELYSDFKDLKKARKRYLSLYNTHPFWTPLLVGYFLFLESKISKGVMAPVSLDKIKTTTIYTLSAIGDSFFGGSLLIFWALVCICLLLSGGYLGALLWFALFFILLHVFKFITFWLGWTQGLAFLKKLQQIDLMGWGQRIKFLNMLLLLCLWYTISPWKMEGEKFLLGSAGLAVTGYIVYKQFISREILFYICVASVVLFILLCS